MAIIRIGKASLAATIGLGLAMFHSVTAFGAAPAISLDDSVAMALKSNPAIKMALDDRDKAAWNIKAAQAGKSPTLALTSGGTRSSGLAGDLPGDNFSTSLRLNWPLYTGGRNEALIDQARLNANAAVLGVTKAEQQLRLEATTAYYGALQARNMVKVNDAAVANLAGHLEQVKAQYAVGRVAKADVLRSEVELANARQNLIKARNDYDVALTILHNIIGLPLDRESTLKDELEYAKFDLGLDDCVRMALVERPEVSQSLDAIAAAQAGVNLAASGYRPTLAFTGSQSWSGPDFPGQGGNWSIGLSASWNICDAGLTRAQAKQAQTAVDKARQSDQQLRDGIALDVRQAYLGLKEAEQRISTAQVVVGKAFEEQQIVATKYNAGVGTNLDVIDAQLALTQANTNYTQALYDYNTNKAKLNRAVGRI